MMSSGYCDGFAMNISGGQEALTKQLRWLIRGVLAIHVYGIYMNNSKIKNNYINFIEKFRIILANIGYKKI